MTARRAQAGRPEGGVLPDLNVWLAVAVAEHPHHGAAQAYWQQEAAACEQTLAGLLEAGTPPRLWTDTYLAAFALADGLRLVTFDRDFARFAGTARLQLSAR